MKQGIWFLWMGIEAYQDWKSRKISLFSLMAGTIAGLLFWISEWWIRLNEAKGKMILMRETDLKELLSHDLSRLFPGGLFWVTHFFQRDQVGEGDIWLLLGSFGFMNGEEIWNLSMTALGISILLGIYQKVKRPDEREKTGKQDSSDITDISEGIPFAVCLFLAGIFLLLPGKLL